MNYFFKFLMAIATMATIGLFQVNAMNPLQQNNPNPGCEKYLLFSQAFNNAWPSDQKFPEFPQIILSFDAIVQSLIDGVATTCSTKNANNVLNALKKVADTCGPCLAATIMSEGLNQSEVELCQILDDNGNTVLHLAYYYYGKHSPYLCTDWNYKKYHIIVEVLLALPKAEGLADRLNFGGKSYLDRHIAPFGRYSWKKP